MKKIQLIIMIMLSFPELSMAQDKPITTMEGIGVPSEIISDLKHEALTGSGESARKLANHYLMTQDDKVSALKWALISAENGDVRGEYLSGYLLKDREDKDSKIRAIFWLRKAADRGSEPAQTLLREIKK